jgi:hypothetical protein
MQRCNIVFPLTIYQIVPERNKNMSDNPFWVFRWLYVGLGVIYYCLMCIVTHRKYAEMQYCLSVYNVPDSIRMKYGSVG